ncbi:hypothetical protein KFL_003480090 [Klebsormidium nitens]|uniref:F-box domain-containing protein n=1 Tax=Klebsormidium nitens TaxID=105231 RepID=A0A1Y1I8Q2_KLENI|nr:hypothetical protein KFL_003480090 [Klebsormidium nitens]|eukprot:GAQ87365.1 hypothetical protein KFL_003480090 [Klebsormidium nitens]
MVHMVNMELSSTNQRAELHRGGKKDEHREDVQQKRICSCGGKESLARHVAALLCENMESPGSVCWIASLEDNLLDLILGKVLRSSARSSFRNLLLVCKDWRRITARYALNWDCTQQNAVPKLGAALRNAPCGATILQLRFDVDGTWTSSTAGRFTPEGFEALKAALLPAKDHARVLHLVQFPVPLVVFLPFLHDGLPCLESCSIDVGYGSSARSLALTPWTDMVEPLWSRPPPIPPAPSLLHLTLTACGRDLRDEFLVRLQEAFPRLETLVLSGVSQLRAPVIFSNSLFEVDISGVRCTISSCTVRAASLACLRLFLSSSTGMGATHLEAPRLEHLCIFSGFNGAISQAPRSIKHLTIESHDWWRWRYFEHQLSFVKQDLICLQLLFTGHGDVVGAPSLQGFLQALASAPALESLEISARLLDSLPNAGGEGRFLWGGAQLPLVRHLSVELWQPSSLEKGAALARACPALRQFQVRPLWPLRGWEKSTLEAVFPNVEYLEDES